MTKCVKIWHSQAGHRQ